MTSLMPYGYRKVSDAEFFAICDVFASLSKPNALTFLSALIDEGLYFRTFLDIQPKVTVKSLFLEEICGEYSTEARKSLLLFGFKSKDFTAADLRMSCASLEEIDFCLSHSLEDEPSRSMLSHSASVFSVEAFPALLEDFSRLALVRSSLFRRIGFQLSGASERCVQTIQTLDHDGFTRTLSTEIDFSQHSDFSVRGIHSRSWASMGLTPIIRQEEDSGPPTPVALRLPVPGADVECTMRDCVIDKCLKSQPETVLTPVTSVQESSVSMPARVSSPVLHNSLTFGQVESREVETREGDFPGPSGGFFKTELRGPRANELRKKLEVLCGVKWPNSALYESALVTYTTGTVPPSFNDGGAQLRNLENLGDSALATALVTQCYRSGTVVSNVQALKSSRLTNSRLSQVFCDSELFSCVSFAPGVDPRVSKVGANALEAIAGLLFNVFGIDSVHVFATSLGVF